MVVIHCLFSYFSIQTEQRRELLWEEVAGCFFFSLHTCFLKNEAPCGGLTLINVNDHLVLCDIAIAVSIMVSLNFIQKSDVASPYN